MIDYFQINVVILLKVITPKFLFCSWRGEKNRQVSTMSVGKSFNLGKNEFYTFSPIFPFRSPRQHIIISRLSLTTSVLLNSFRFDRNEISSARTRNIYCIFDVNNSNKRRPSNGAIFRKRKPIISVLQFQRIIHNFRSRAPLICLLLE